MSDGAIRPAVSRAGRTPGNPNIHNMLCVILPDRDGNDFIIFFEAILGPGGGPIKPGFRGLLFESPARMAGAGRGQGVIMSPKLFRYGDGIRGRANGLITPELALKVGQAAGLVFQRGEHRHRVVIGKDNQALRLHDRIRPWWRASPLSGMDVLAGRPDADARGCDADQVRCAPISA